MSEVATVWAKAQTCPSALAKDVLKTMAPYFDVRGEGWAAVPVLAFETGKSERQVQRGLAQLKAAGLLLPTDRTETYMGRVYPVYRMPLDQGPANTRQALKLLYAESDARGDAGVTPSGAGCHGRHPTGDTDVTPRGDTGVTQIGKEIPQGETHQARAQAPASEVSEFEEVKRAWIGIAAERVDPDQSAKAWAIAVRDVGAADLAGAALRYLAEAGEVKRGHVRELHRWLSGRRYEAWLAKPAGLFAPTNPISLEHLPADFVAAAKSACGEKAAVSWLAKAEWRSADRTVVVGATAFDWLNRNLRRELAEHTIKIETRNAA